MSKTSWGQIWEQALWLFLLSDIISLSVCTASTLPGIWQGDGLSLAQFSPGWSLGFNNFRFGQLSDFGFD
ncbi:MAG TPA: hypothetical protein VIQ31_12095 [Phormidium sp.]